MTKRQELVIHTRNYVLSVCALMGGAEFLLFSRAGEFLVKFAAVSFIIAIIIGVVHVGALYFIELYGDDEAEKDIGFLSIKVRGRFSLVMFILLVAIGLLSLLTKILLV